MEEVLSTVAVERRATHHIVGATGQVEHAHAGDELSVRVGGGDAPVTFLLMGGLASSRALTRFAAEGNNAMPWEQAWAMWLLFAALLIFLLSAPARTGRG